MAPVVRAALVQTARPAMHVHDPAPASDGPHPLLGELMTMRPLPECAGSAVDIGTAVFDSGAATAGTAGTTTAAATAVRHAGVGATAVGPNSPRTWSTPVGACLTQHYRD